MRHIPPCFQNRVKSPAASAVAPATATPYNWGNRSSEGNLDQDVIWIRQIAKGDIEAFERLYHAYERRLYIFLYRKLNNHDAAAEAMNDTMLVVWQKAESFEGRSKPSTWIFGIANRKANDYFKRLSSQPPGEELAESLADPNEPEPSRFARRERVARALKKLSPQHREVLVLTFYCGFSYKEIAAIVDCPVNTVKTRMHHAKLRLRALLDEQ